MGIATSTAIAIGGLALSAGTTAMSFSQASKQKKAQRQAEIDADKAMAEARGKLDVNFAEQMSVKKEAYDNEREALLVQGAMATQAGIESERGSAASAGRVYAAQQAGQANVRGAMADEMTNIENAIIEEDSRLRDLDVSLDLEEVAGNQQKAADAQRAAEAAKQQGIQGAISTVQQGIAMAPLYGQNTSAQKAAVGQIDPFTAEQTSAFNKAGTSTFADANTIAAMSNSDFRKYKRSLTPQQEMMIFGNQQYVQAYQNPFDAYLGNTAGTTK
jgi:hypothetical protein